VFALVLPLLVVGCGSKTIGAALDDATITAHVKTALLNDPQVSALKIDVSTTNGVVTMSGTVRSKGEEERAIQLARQVSGVKEVKSTLEVGG
jgi:hyperosmotically inducible protein